MSHIQEGESGPSAVERAEELVNHAGQRLGLFAALAGVRVLQTTLALSERMIRQRIAQLSQTEKGSTKQQEQPRSTPATNHTEQLVERMGQQLGSFTALASRSVLSAGTRIREEAKDIWTEAQAPITRRTPVLIHKRMRHQRPGDAKRSCSLPSPITVAPT